MKKPNNSIAKQTLEELDKIKEFNDQLEEDISTAAKSHDTDAPLEVALFYRPAMILARFFVRHGQSPNTVTMLSLLCGVAGSFFFYPQNVYLNFIGILLELCALLFDCCDGQVARITNSSSQLGRFLDGMVDTVNFAAVYIVLALRMMHETIPFAGVKWGASIWLIIIINGYCHAEQARMADYYRGLHLAFLGHDNTANFTSSEKVKTELDESKDTPLYNRIYLFLYYQYTKAQERMTPKAQILLGAIRANGRDIPAGVSEEYISRSRKYIQLTNILTYTGRAYSLYLMILLKLHHFYPLLVVFVLGGIMIFMIRKYEGIAEDIYMRFYQSGR